MSKTKKSKKKPLLFPPGFVIAVAEKGLGFVKDKITLHGPTDIPVWRNPQQGNTYVLDNGPIGLEALFLSPEGRDLIECEAEKLGVDMGGSFFSALDEQGREQEPQNPLWHYEFGGFMATHRD